MEVNTQLCLGFYVMFPAVLFGCTKIGRWRQISIKIFNTIFYARTQQNILCVLNLEIPLVMCNSSHYLAKIMCSFFIYLFIFIYSFFFFTFQVRSGAGGRVFSVSEVSMTGYGNNFARQSAATTAVRLTCY
jgi:hypothetical protein